MILSVAYKCLKFLVKRHAARQGGVSELLAPLAIGGFLGNNNGLAKAFKDAFEQKYLRGFASAVDAVKCD